jgi:hypothetical protein
LHHASRFGDMFLNTPKITFESHTGLTRSGGEQRSPRATDLIVFVHSGAPHWGAIVGLVLGRRDDLILLQQVRKTEKVLRDQVIMFGVARRATGIGKFLKFLCARPKAPRTRKRVAH